MTEVLVGLLFVALPVVLMAALRWSALKTGIALLALAVAYSLAVLGLGALGPALEGLIKGARVAAIAFSAYIFYLAYREAGYEQELTAKVLGGGAERAALAVYLGGFLEAVSGYGVPAAVVAPLLASAGLSETRALVAALLGHSWAVPFASLGVPTLALSLVTDVGPKGLSVTTAALLAAPFALLTALTSRTVGASSKHAIGLACLSLALMVTVASLGRFSALVAGAVGLVLVFAMRGRLHLLRPLAPYMALAALLTLVSLAGLRSLEVQAATVLLLAVLLVVSKRGDPRRFVSSLTPALKTAVTLVVLSTAAILASRSGMLGAIAQQLTLLGEAYTYLVPLVGFLGAYVSGSCTASNLLFGVLQREFAEVVGVSKELVLAFHNAGGSVGSVVSPAKVAVGASTLRSADESAAFRKVLPLALAVAVVLCIEAVLLATL